MLYKIFRFLLFLLPPEFTHTLAIRYLKIKYACPWFINHTRKHMPSNPVEFCGMSLPNPIGLAGGFDKNGSCIDELFALGFGFIEVGTVTPLAQPGNPKPRLFRLVKHQALINRMGFNNAGVDSLVENLRKRKVAGIVGVNIGKNKTTPLQQAYRDYQICLEKVYPYADYITINISSPNTPGLRQLNDTEYLDNLLAKITATRHQQAQIHGKQLPLLLKISVDLPDDELSGVLTLIKRYDLQGIITSNTTVERNGVSNHKQAAQRGGLSGKPLTHRSQQQIQRLRKLDDQLALVGVGGIMSVNDAQQRLAAGANLIQIYSGLIYNGPGFIRSILKKQAVSN